MPSGAELTEEERELARLRRPRVPLTSDQQKGLLEMLDWFEEQQAIAKIRLKISEARWKHFPVVFGVIFGALGAVSGIITLYLRFYP